MSNKGNSDQITRDYFDSMLLETRYIDSDLPNVELTLFGEPFKTPIMTTALSHLHHIVDDAMAEYAVGARDAGTLHWVGMGDDDELPHITETGAKTIKIIKPHADNDKVFEKLQLAKSAGCFGVGMDIDHAFNGSGGYDVVLDLPMKPKSLNELKEFISYTDLPFIVKGVLSATDAEKCVTAGAKGILVSHHHGIMDYSVPPLMILPEIVKAVDGEIPIFVDCGITSGMDAFKALALGATAVGVGRELMGPLKDGGSAVAKRIIEMTGELKAIMARTGAKSLAEIDPSVIHYKNF